jgi:hypothetical protein
MRPNKTIYKLIANLKTAPSAGLDAKVNQAIDNALAERKRIESAYGPSIGRIIMKNPITKLAAAAMIFTVIIISATLWNKKIPTVIPTASASAVEVLTDAAKAVENVQSIHIKAQMRTLPRDNMGMIGLEFDFVPIEMWKKTNDAGIVLWRIEKPGRVVVTDGNSTIMLIKPNYVVKGDGPYPIGCFDTWYGHLMNVDKIIDNALKNTMNQSGSQMCMRNKVVKEGAELVLEIESAAQGDFTNDWCKNTFITESDHKKVYRFDAETKLLKGFEVFVHTDKEDVLVFEVNDIEYNPRLDDKLFTIDLPADVIMHEQAKVLPDNEKYQKMTPKQAAETFFRTCAEENWDEYLKFDTQSRVSDQVKEAYGGLKIINIGEPFKSGLYGGWFVPYEIKLKSGRVKKWNLAVRNDNPAKRWVVDGGF